MIRHPEPTPDSSMHFERARLVASLFDLPGPLGVYDFPDKGNINQQTYLITAGRPDEHEHRQYLLQLLNPGVFTQPGAVMEAMISCIRAQKEALSKDVIHNDEWETLRLVPTRDGKDYLALSGKSGRECWRLMVKIGDARTFHSLREIRDPDLRINVAEQAGRGLATFGTLTAEMDAAQTGCPLPGYRDTELYYNQLLSVLAGCRTGPEAAPYLPPDPAVRKSTERHFLVRLDQAEYRRRMEDPQLRRFVDLALDEKPFGLTLIRKLRSGELRKVIVHGDTKLDNFLFSTRTGCVKAMVDLDTIMPHTWLTDWGDMVRSLVNIAGEKEEDPDRVEVDDDVFAALARGFLGSAHRVTPGEVALMVEAPQIMALELGIRFLADYLRGDSYFRLGAGEPRDLNKIRAIVQFRVFERLRSKADSARQTVESLFRK